MRKTILAAAMLAVSLPVAAPALADPPPWAPAHGRREHDGDWQDRGDRGGYGYQRGYAERRDWHRQERVMTRNDRIWYANGGYRCRRSDGTTGTIVGAALGGLLGNGLAGRGDRTLGTILGVTGGAVIGRSIDRGEVHCR
ncbi:MAG: glycine zipper 2TM domain-containing protein [Sphingomonadales bacterium]|nr:glycine zipper 2TM domain-containing protein [Sphingomonadales bacterium]